jgi:hypothetical protein
MLHEGTDRESFRSSSETEMSRDQEEHLHDFVVNIDDAVGALSTTPHPSGELPPRPGKAIEGAEC